MLPRNDAALRTNSGKGIISTIAGFRGKHPDDPPVGRATGNIVLPITIADAETGDLTPPSAAPLEPRGHSPGWGSET